MEKQNYTPNAFYYKVLSRREELAKGISCDIHYRLGDNPEKEKELNGLNKRLQNDETLFTLIL